MLEIHRDAIKPGERVLIFDDLLATGGTARAVTDLVRKMGGEIVEVAFMIELLELGGRERLLDCPVFSPDSVLSALSIPRPILLKRG